MRIALLFFLVISFCAQDLHAQKRRSSRDDSRRQYESLRERLFVGTYINTPSFGGNFNGTAFQMGVQPFAGYRFNEIMSAGVAFKFDYTYFWGGGNSESFTVFSATSFLRATLAERIILQVDGGWYSNQSFLTGITKQRNNFPVLFVGGGYSWGNTEIILAFETLGNLQFYRLPIEYKFGFLFDL